MACKVYNRDFEGIANHHDKPVDCQYGIHVRSGFSYSAINEP
jgi:hypothetical protein